jgi:hypothetical protein
MSLCTCRGDGALCRTCRTIRERLTAQNPPCIFCGRPCVTGQRDADAFPAHLSCQRTLAGARPAERREPQ